MGSVLKGNRYRLVDNRSFDLPLSVKYVLLKEDNEIAEYEVVNNEKVSCRIITKYKENMITPIHRPLTIADIYYFFSTRVFQDKTPFTGTELALLGLEKYNVYDIIRKTRGVTPYDDYWLKFDGDKCDYDKARSDWEKVMSKISEPPAVNAPGPQSDANINEILGQHKVDVAAKMSESAGEAEAQPAPEANTAAEAAPVQIESNTMSADEIEALLMKSGLTEQAEEAFGGSDDNDNDEEDSEVSGASGGKMSQDDIEKMLAAATASVENTVTEAAETAVETVEEAVAAPAEEPKPSGGKMSQDDIEKMLAAATASVENTVTEAAETAVEAVEEAAAPAEEPKPSGGKMSQDDIEKMLAAASEAVQQPIISEPEPVQETLADSVAVPPSEPSAPAEEAKPSGGKMSQADIEALLNGMKDDVK
ncbi:MAG: hypothetical protein K2N56_02760 [Oscillospiraceae bacterium]|nr:hypothetical protein [Oscillospiraceae bacterium]